MLGSDVIDRVQSEWLYPAGVNRPSVDVLAVDINDAVRTFRVEGRIKELPTGGILEIEDELMPIKSRVGTDVTVLERGYLESAAAPHVAGKQIRLNPEFSRITIFNAIRTVIGLLYSWSVYRREVDVSRVGTISGIIPMAAEAKRIISVRPARSGGRWGPPLQAGFDYDELKDVAGAPELQMYRASGKALRIVYATDFVRPATPATDLDALEIPQSIQEGLPMAVAGHVLQGREIPRLNIEQIRNLLGLAGAQVPVGATFNVAQALLSGFRQLYVNAEIARLSEQDPTTFEYVAG